jgi:hypothetical protein
MAQKHVDPEDPGHWNKHKLCKNVRRNGAGVESKGQVLLKKKLVISQHGKKIQKNCTKCGR